MTDLGDRRILADGTVVCSEAAAVEMLYRGSTLDGLLLEPSEDVELFNQSNQRLDAGLPMLETGTDQLYGDLDWYSMWMTPDGFDQVDVRGFCLSMCKDDSQRKRVNMEMDLYEERNMLLILQHLIYMVSDLRNRGILWGVGRGSSVSSYVLYLIGINRINPLKFNLDIREFLK